MGNQFANVNCLFTIQVGVVQLSSSVVSVQKHKTSVQLDLPLRIAGVDLCENNLMVWGEGKVVVYQLGISATNEKPFAVGN